MTPVEWLEEGYRLNGFVTKTEEEFLHKNIYARMFRDGDLYKPMLQIKDDPLDFFSYATYHCYYSRVTVNLENNMIDYSLTEKDLT